jgi:hypothetical protein
MDRDYRRQVLSLSFYVPRGERVGITRDVKKTRPKAGLNHSVKHDWTTEKRNAHKSAGK